MKSQTERATFRTMMTANASTYRIGDAEHGVRLRDNRPRRATTDRDGRDQRQPTEMGDNRPRRARPERPARQLWLHGIPLWYGRTARLTTPAHRTRDPALFASYPAWIYSWISLFLVIDAT